MKMQIIGLEGSAGVSKKTGEAYDMGSIHAIVKMASPFGKGNVATGSIGATYRCAFAIIKTVAHLPCPFVAEVQTEDISRFGKLEPQVVGIVPEKLGK